MALGIILTIITGLFFLIGISVLNNVKSKSSISKFTISLASVVILGLLLFDLLPELLETKNILLIIPGLIGLLLLVLLDQLIPHHHHEHKDGDDDEKDHQDHLNHIGIVTILALAIHNMIEGLTLYNVTLNSFKAGLLMMLGISLHNIPLGFQLGNTLKKKNSLLTTFLCLSSFLGALIIIIFGSLSENITNVLLSLTFGMLLYILIFELLLEVKKYLKSKETLYGILLGIAIVLVAMVI